jgi:hypothetical protein
MYIERFHIRQEIPPTVEFVILLGESPFIIVLKLGLRKIISRLEAVGVGEPVIE